MLTYLQRIEWFIGLVLLQVQVLNHMHINGYATPFFFIYFILKYNSGVSRNVLMIWAFLLGLTVDILRNTPGMNAAAATVLAFMREPVQATLTAPVTQLSVINASGSNLNSQTITMCLTQGTGANKISWPSNVKWSYGREPVLTFTKDSIDVIQFLSIDGGSTWYGSLLMADLQEL